MITEVNTMPIRTIKQALLLTSLMISLGGCSISDWYNGYYAEAAAMDRYDKRVNAFYAAESPEMKELRRKNNNICLKHVSHSVTKGSGLNGSALYEKCMIDRGTPEP